jgi:GntR family transcriptional regulator, transcriptional repressor for pyruvate dehydrogenase complex
MTSRGTGATFKIFPIRQVDVYRGVLRQLDEIVSNSGLKPGDRLGSERELAEQFGVSRVPVREALRALESMGKIEIRPASGSYVADPKGNLFAAEVRAGAVVDERFLNELVALRSAIETKIVELVAALPARDLSSIVDVLASIEAELAHTRREEGSLDLRFEAALGRLSGNQLLERVQRSVHQLWVDSWSEIGAAPGDRRELHNEHGRILLALESGEGDKARDLMDRHVNRLVRASRRAGKRKAVG